MTYDSAVLAQVWSLFALIGLWVMGELYDWGNNNIHKILFMVKTDPYF